MRYLFQLFVFNVLTFSLIASAQVPDPNESKTPQDSASIEKITVTGQVPHYQQLLTVLGTTSLNPEELAGSGLQLSELVDSAPEVSLNGQGGIMQMYSIRGLSRWRVQTLVDGIPIHSDRRAGSGAEFIAPAMIGNINVVPGAASTYFGSGAIGGAIDIQLNQQPADKVGLSLQSNGQSEGIYWGGSNQLSGWQLHSRNANNSHSANKDPIFNQYEQHSAFYSRQLEHDNFDDVWMLATVANNIGKANSDNVNSRRSLYPKNDHLLGKFNFVLPALFNDGNADVYFHYSELITDVNRVDVRKNVVENSALDLGGSMSVPISANNFEGNWRIAFDGRENVTAKEWETPYLNTLLASQASIFYQSLDARQWESSTSLDIATKVNGLDLLFGTRVSNMFQENVSKRSEKSSINDLNMSGFIAVNNAIFNTGDNQVNLTAMLSSAYRVPSLTERFYFGETPRGKVLGNLELKTEKSVSAEIGIRGTSQFSQNKARSSVSFSWAVNAHYQNVDNYIERITQSDTTLQYHNIESGKIKGMNYQLALAFPHFLQDAQLVIDLSGHTLSGKSESNQPLADINPVEHEIKVKYANQRLSANLGVKYRAKKDEIASGEQSISNVSTVNASVSYSFTADTKLKLWANNLTNQLYLVSADDKAPFAVGKQLGLEFSWFY